MSMKPLPGGGYYAGETLPYGIGTAPKGKITIGAVSIYPTSLSAQPDAEIKEYKGPTGQVITLVVPVQYVTISGDGWIEGNDAHIGSIKKGESCTITGDAVASLGLTAAQLSHLRLETISGQFSNEDVAKVSFTLKEYPQIDADS